MEDFQKKLRSKLSSSLVIRPLLPEWEHCGVDFDQERQDDNAYADIPALIYKDE